MSARAMSKSESLGYELTLCDILDVALVTEASIIVSGVRVTSIVSVLLCKLPVVALTSRGFIRHLVARKMGKEVL